MRFFNSFFVFLTPSHFFVTLKYFQCINNKAERLSHTPILPINLSLFQQFNAMINFVKFFWTTHI